MLAVGSESHAFGVCGADEHCWFLDSKKETVAFQKQLTQGLIQAVTHVKTGHRGNWTWRSPTLDNTRCGWPSTGHTADRIR